MPELGDTIQIVVAGSLVTGTIQSRNQDGTVTAAYTLNGSPFVAIVEVIAVYRQLSIVAPSLVEEREEPPIIDLSALREENHDVVSPNTEAGPVSQNLSKSQERRLKVHNKKHP